MVDYNPQDGEPPLDPAAERLRRKLVRLLLGSGLIMMLGLIAVFSAIVYKVSDTGTDRVASTEPLLARAGGPIEASIAVPAGSRLVSAQLDGNRALLHLQAENGVASLLLVDLASGQTLGRYPLQPR